MNWLSLQTTTQTVAQIAVEHILNALPLGLLIAVFAWGLLRVLRRQNSGTRFAVWFLALLAVAALPLLGGLGEGRATIVMGAAVSPGTPWESMRPALTIPATWGLIVFVAWALGASLAMARLSAGLWRLRQLRRSCIPIVTADLEASVRKTVDAISASDSVTVATSEHLRVPAAIGFWKRTIVLPAWALQEMPSNDLNVILLHEFAHLRRWDDWTNLIQKIVRAVFFFHPAVWWIENRLSVEREMACDDAVLAQTANPHGYATCLVSLLEKSLAHRLSPGQWSMAQAAVNRVREASLRLARILDAKRPVATRVWKPALGMVGAFSMVCLMALPHAPQFVAVDRGMMASGSDHVYPGALSQSSLQLPSSSLAVPVIPAAWRTSESSSAKTTAKPIHARLVPGQRSASTRVIHVPSNELFPGEQVVAISASADEEFTPAFQTLVFVETTVETTRYGTADSSVWRVQVWRVMLVGPVHDRWMAIPVASSI